MSMVTTRCFISTFAISPFSIGAYCLPASCSLVLKTFLTVIFAPMA